MGERAQAPFGPIARHRVADFFGAGEAYADTLGRGLFRRALASLNEKTARTGTARAGGGEKLAAFLKMGEPGQLTLRATCDPVPDGGSGSYGRSWWPCASENHGGVCEPGWMADMCVS